MCVSVSEDFKGRRQVRGKLVRSAEDGVRLGIRGRIVTIPSAIVEEVRLCKGDGE